MPFASSKIRIDAPYQRVLDFLIDKQELPKKYVGGIQWSKVLERQDGYIIREMYEPAPADLHIREKIYHHPVEGGEEFIYEHMNNARYTGVFRNILTRIAGSDDAVELEYVMDWKPHPGTEEQLSTEKAQSMVDAAVKHMKSLAEDPVNPPAIVCDFFRTVDAMDFEGMRALFTEDVRFRMGSHPELLGRDRVIESNSKVRDIFHSLKHHFVSTHSADHRHFVECWVDYLLPDGKDYLLPFMTVIEERDGKIASVKVFGDLTPLAHGWPAH